MSWAAVIGAAASLIGSAIQNRSNKKEAEKNRNFQEEMSSTAYQRSADDLEAAGLNRVLALGSPASTPSGAQAIADVPDLGSAVQTGIHAASAKQQIEQSKAEERLLDQRKNESMTSEHLMQEQAIREQTQANLNRRQAIREDTQADLNRTNTRLNSAKAIKEERLTPAYDLIGDMTQSGVDFAKSAAKQWKEGSGDSITTRARKAIEAQMKSWADSFNRRKAKGN